MPFQCLVKQGKTRTVGRDFTKFLVLQDKLTDLLEQFFFGGGFGIGPYHKAVVSVGKRLDQRF